MPIDEIEARCREVERLSKQGEFQAALRLCNELVESNPEDRRPLRTRTFLHSRMGDNNSALSDASGLVRLAPEEPCYRFERSFWHLELGNYDEAIVDLTDALRLCDKWKSDY